MIWTTNDIPPQHGRLAIVTGGNSGIGYDTSAALAAAGAEVIVAGRDAARCEEAVSRIRAIHPDAKIRFERLDLGSLASVREFAAGIADAHGKLDLLINNAGVMALPKRQVTEDGFERQLGVNFLGHFALTALLMPLLDAAYAPRTVQLASLAHKPGRINFDDLQSEKRYSPQKAYYQSKLAMLMFGIELGRRAQAAGSKLLSTSAHPGWANTSLLTNGLGTILVGRIVAWIWPKISQSSEAGAWPTLYAATAPDAVQGGYYGPQGKGERKGPPGPAVIAPQARDESVAARLWEEAERLTGQRLQIT